MGKTPAIRICSQCGARLSDGTERCDLCGLRVGDDPANFASDVAERVVVVDEGPPAPGTPAAIYCNDCGWKNPPAARFCSQCGVRLQDIAVKKAAVPAPRAAGSRPETPNVGQSGDSSGKVTRQVALIVAAGVLVTVALFMVTVLSRDLALKADAQTIEDVPAAIPEGPPSTEPLSPQLEERVAALEAQIDDLSGEDRLAKQRDLVQLYLMNARVDRAALVQQQVAEVQDSPEEWALAGNLFYGWMQEEEGPAKIQAGRQAIAAYERVLERQPDNLAVRTDMATAYLGTNNPMEGVRQIKMVLESDPDHMQANFNYGVMLSMIGRVDQAVAQFEKVKSLVPEESEDYRLAQEAIETLRNRAAQP